MVLDCSALHMHYECMYILCNYRLYISKLLMEVHNCVLTSVFVFLAADGVFFGVLPFLNNKNKAQCHIKV